MKNGNPQDCLDDPDYQSLMEQAKLNSSQFVKSDPQLTIYFEQSTLDFDDYD